MTKAFKNLAIVAILASSLASWAQDLPTYQGKELSNPDYHHGQLAPAIGVHNIQLTRANREFPEYADGLGYTYNHQPMLAYWNNTFYLEYLANPVGEHEPGGATLIMSSKDGYNWSNPQVIFEPYKIPDGTKKETKRNGIQETKDLLSVHHQRMGFYVSEKYDKLLVLANISICLDITDAPNDGNGVGRVVREINKDGSWGETYFIYYNHDWNSQNTSHPYYKESKDKNFVKACDELLNNRLMVQQWNEEIDREDPLLSLQGEYKAFNWYHLTNGNVVGWWKHALTAISTDEGKTWTKPTRAPGFVNNNAKIWGQKLDDGNYMTVYNPSDYRWPLALSTSNDGMNFNNLLLVHGEVSPMRYGGNYKSYGPQYVRGIVEGNGNVPGNDAWVSYSVNKEDIWVAKIPVPVKSVENNQVNEQFNAMKEGSELLYWNIYSPVWARVAVENVNGKKALVLHDQDEYEFAKAERVFPKMENAAVEFSIQAAQNKNGKLDVELLDENGMAALRLTFAENGYIQQKNGYRMKDILKYNAKETLNIRIELTCHSRFFYIYVNGEKVSTGMSHIPVPAVERLSFRTGDIRRYPNIDTPTDQDWDIKQNGQPCAPASFAIFNVKTEAFTQK
ncbi:MAG: exo-alpha-sialidase [Mangrovibacterium sp.]